MIRQTNKTNLHYNCNVNILILKNESERNCINIKDLVDYDKRIITFLSKVKYYWDIAF